MNLTIGKAYAISLFAMSGGAFAALSLLMYGNATTLKAYLTMLGISISLFSWVVVALLMHVSHIGTSQISPNGD